MQEKAYVCSVCLKEFIPRDKRYAKNCNRECGFKYQARERHLNKNYRDLAKVFKSLITKLINILKLLSDCPICEKKFINKYKRARCSYECDVKYACYKKGDKWNIVEFQCKNCGENFNPEYGDKRRSFCSEKCSKRSAKRARRKTDAYKRRHLDDNHKRRAVKKQAFISNVKRLEIFERDKWICQLCSKKVNKKLKYPHLMSASLDHIVPLALGGKHEPKNCQLAHFICNSKKSSKAMNEQIRMF